MNGIHDCGGMQGFGALGHVAREPMFHAAWEGRICAISRSIGLARKARVTVGLRWGIEMIPAIDQVRMSYFEKWYASVVNRLVECGIASSREIDRGRPDTDKRNIAIAGTVADAIQANLARPTGANPSAAPAAFKIGDRVRARNINPTTHTRLPRYLRAKSGVIVKCQGAWDFPDTDPYNLPIAARNGRTVAEPVQVYSVRFTAREVWGDEASPKDVLYADLFEAYLEPA